MAGEKKGLLMLDGVLSAVSALCMLVPYWSVYEVLKELLLHGSKISEFDSSVLIEWGWVAFGCLVAGLLLLYGA
ncbi:ABC transporter ATP-binding protein, partial [Bacteroides thetaiotaomicron]|nr:ABC transporter ATP-binding protein [Bacteroides thetaiotaomicron]